MIASLAPELDVALSRQARMGDPSPGHPADTPLPYDHLASEAAALARVTLSAWVVAVDPAAEPAGGLGEMAAWLLARRAKLAMLPDAGHCADEIAHVAATAERAVDRPPERRYAGPCGVCGQPLYAKPGAATVTCRDHEPLWKGDVDERRKWMLTEISSRYAHAASAVHLLGLLGVRITPVRVTRWKQAGLLTSSRTDLYRRPLYRIGDLIDLAATDKKEGTADEHQQGEDGRHVDLTAADDQAAEEQAE